MRVWLWLIGALEIVGGACGIAAVAWRTASQLGNIFTTERVGTIGPSTFLYAVAAVVVYSLSLYAGVALLRGRPSGRTLSIVVQALQLPKLQTPLLVYSFSFGFDLFVYYARTRGPVSLGIDYVFPSSHWVSLDGGGGVMYFGVSLTAWLFLLVLFRVGRLVREGEAARHGADTSVSTEA